MSNLTIRPAYRTWPTYNERLRDVVAAMTEDQLAILPVAGPMAALGDRGPYRLPAGVLALRLRR